MKEADIRREVYGLLRRYGYTPHRLRDAILCPRCGARVLPTVSGRPDILANSAYGPGIYVEVKSLAVTRQKSFFFSAITPEQRRYMDRRTAEGFRCYLALGTVGEKAPHRALWLIDWPAWKEIESLIQPIQASIPLRAGKGYARSLQEGKLDLVHLCQEFRLIWADGKWHLPHGHSAHQDTPAKEAECPQHS